MDEKQRISLRQINDPKAKVALIDIPVAALQIVIQLNCQVPIHLRFSFIRSITA